MALLHRVSVCELFSCHFAFIVPLFLSEFPSSQITESFSDHKFVVTISHSECLASLSFMDVNEHSTVIQLKKRNWENHGTDIVIWPDGRYTVTASFLGRTKMIREGNLHTAQLDKFSNLIKKMDMLQSKKEYSAPFKTTTSWWGYELTVNTKEYCKHIRFHTEDDTVPLALQETVGTILEITH